MLWAAVGVTRHDVLEEEVMESAVHMKEAIPWCCHRDRSQEFRHASNTTIICMCFLPEARPNLVLYVHTDIV